jgi:hypothetical protein
MVATVHVFIFSAIVQIEVYYCYCSIQPGLYTTVVTYCSLLKETSIPLITVFFGLWSVKNIRRMRRVAFVPVISTTKSQTVNGPHGVHAKVRQLIFMLLINIVIYILFSLIVAITLLYNQFTQYQIKRPKEIQTELYLANLAQYSVHVPLCITSYAHLLVSKTFRNESKRIFLWNRWFGV